MNTNIPQNLAEPICVRVASLQELLTICPVLQVVLGFCVVVLSIICGVLLWRTYRSPQVGEGRRQAPYNTRYLKCRLLLDRLGGVALLWGICQSLWLLSGSEGNWTLEKDGQVLPFMFFFFIQCTNALFPIMAGVFVRFLSTASCAVLDTLSVSSDNIQGGQE